MADEFDRALLNKRLAQRRRHSSIKTLYGDKLWVEDLDIINELGGHRGCVNALSWSKSGTLLASGSDDTHLNIWSYNPDSMAKPFTLSTCVATGHVANIFSTKFMPHSNDRTLVTCAGDSEVRVFDIERGGASGNASDQSRASSIHTQRFQRFFASANFLNDGNTNTRVYRSHSDRVKRIVTESSPYLFLTCAEDGEVRQWDLRQPSSAYPAPRGGTGFMSFHREDHDDSNVPPPLISYKKYRLDLNTISCSPSQPHYIALGGNHLHCFLHDRRMLGRDLAAEQGKPASRTPEPGTYEDELMGNATRCVKRFAPSGKQQMAIHDNGHITASKISDANPNEMIVSWSGDHIYSFDLVQSPDAREAEATKIREHREAQANRVRQSKDRKRKRQAASSASFGEPARTRMARSGAEDETMGISLRVRYGNGQSEDIELNPPSGGTHEQILDQTRDSLLSESQKLSDRVAKALVKLRKTLFDFQSAVQESTGRESLPALTPHTAAFTASLGYAVSLIPQMHDIMSSWRFPLDPSREEVTTQQTLRRDRQSAYRFVQASGTLARVLGGRLQTMDPENDPRLARFQKIVPAPLERDEIELTTHFAYDFLRAILLWLEGGRSALLEGFKKERGQSRFTKRFPLDQSDGDEAIGEKLMPYLLELAGDRAIVNLDVSRFEVDENRVLFETQTTAINSFSRAIDGYDLGWSDEPSIGPNGPRQVLDRAAACRFWGVKVGRSLLMTAGEGINYEFVNHAFGGVDLHINGDDGPDAMDVERDQEDIDVDESDPEVETIEARQTRQPAIEDADDDDEAATDPSSTRRLLRPTRSEGNARTSSHSPSFGLSGEAETGEDDDEDEDADANEPNSDDEEDDDFDINDDDDDAFESDSEDGEGTHHVVFRNSIGFTRSRERARVEVDKPCSAHTRVYKGHCNVKTIKDVNFYGLNDEYVMSGSDDGNFFIWDKKTTKLLNILEGDGEVVNVIQGHPHEPMIAASGIDNTIKIFSPDARLQEDALLGRNISNPGGIAAPSLTHGRRTSIPDTSANNALTSRRRVDQMYQITHRNDVNRQGGVGDAELTRNMLARLAASLNRGQAGLHGGQIVIDDNNCMVM